MIHMILLTIIDYPVINFKKPTCQVSHVLSKIYEIHDFERIPKLWVRINTHHSLTNAS